MPDAELGQGSENIVLEHRLNQGKILAVYRWIFYYNIVLSIVTEEESGYAFKYNDN